MSAGPDEPWPNRTFAFYALAVLLIAYIVAFIDRIIMAMLVGPIRADLGLNDTAIALANGVAFTVFYSLMGLPFGRMVDRVSRKGVIAAGVAIWSLFAAASGLARNFLTLFACRMGVGVGEAALTPGAYSVIADYFPPRVRGRAISIYTLGASLGSGLAYFLGGLLIQFASQKEAIAVPLLGDVAPWRFVFIAMGLPGLVVAVLVLTIKDPPRRSDPEHAASSDGASFTRFLRENRRIVATYLFGYGLMVLPFSALLFWGPAFMARHHHMTPAEIGVAYGLIFLGPGIAGQFAGAALSDWRYGRGVADAHFQTGFICALALVPVALFATTTDSASVSIVAQGLLVFFVCGAVGHQAAVGTLLAPNALRGQLAALYILMQNLLSQILSNVAVAVATDTVLRDSGRIGIAMAVVGVFGGASGAGILSLGLKPLRTALHLRSAHEGGPAMATLTPRKLA